MTQSPNPSRSPNPAKKLAKLIDKYYVDMKDPAHQSVFHEMGTRTPFFSLLADAAKPAGWTLIAEHEKKVGGTGVSPGSVGVSSTGRIRPDGTFKDHMNLVSGYWEANDAADNLGAEIANKRKAGRPTDAVIFEDTATADLFEHNHVFPSIPHGVVPMIDAPIIVRRLRKCSRAEQYPL